MRVGDILEWLAGAAIVVAVYLATGLAWPPLVAAGFVLAYEAQCWAGHPLPRWKRTASPVCDCGMPDGSHFRTCALKLKAAE